LLPVRPASTSRGIRGEARTLEAAMQIEAQMKRVIEAGDDPAAVLRPGRA
jgi:hypothetical protein